MRSFVCLLCAGALLAACWGCTLLPARSASSGTAVQAVQALPVQAAVVPAPTLHSGADPLTGLPLAEGASALQRPLAVMLDNVRAALPQRGLAQASIVYEAVTESGITRLLAVYGDYAALPEIGPVRSARDQHVQLAIPLGALLLHVGGSTYATDLLEIYHYEDKSVNGYYETGALALDTDRNATVAIEHCWFTTGALFSDAAAAYGLSTTLPAPAPAFQFVPYGAAPRILADGDAASVEIRFSSYDTTRLVYSAARGGYEKWQFDAPQIDENTGETVAFTNVLVLFADIDSYPDGVLSRVNFTGGDGFYFCGGRWEGVRWQKGRPEDAITLLAADGSLTEINPGTTYVAVVGSNKYKYFKIQDSHIS